MAGKEENRIFVGGLSWDVTERQLENVFGRFGKIIDSQLLRSVDLSEKFLIMLERDTGRPRGFGFITFADRQGMEDAISEMHGRDFGDRVISVNKAQPRMGEDLDHGYNGGYSSGGRGSYGGGDRSAGQDDCFKCGRPGHWARDCPSSGDGRGRGGALFPSRSRFSSGRGGRFGGERDRYMEDRYDGGHYGDRDHFENRDKYGNRDRYMTDRYAPTRDRFSGDKYGGSDRYGASERYGDSERYPQNGYGKDKGYDRDPAPRGGGDRYGGGGPVRNLGKGYRNRPGPYDRPTRGGRHSSFDRY